MSSLFKKAAEVKEPVKETKEETKAAEAITGSVVLVTEKEEEEADVKLDEFQASASLLEEARAGRNISDIPVNDIYWAIQSEHTLAHHKHIIRTDELDTVKGKPVKR